VTTTTLHRALTTERPALPGSAESQSLRAAALAELAAAGLPTTKRENWRYTDLEPLGEIEVELAARAPDAAAIDCAAQLLAADDLAADAPRIVLVDGHISTELSTLEPTAGVEIGSVEARWSRLDAAQRQRISTAEHPLAALNTAFTQAGPWIRVPDGRRVAEPLHVVHVASGRPNLAPQPRLVLELGRGAELTLVQQFIDVDEPLGWCNCVTQIEQAASSQLALYRVQQHGKGHAHTSLLTAEIASSATLSLALVDLGGRLVRNDVDVKLREPGASVELFGVFLASNGQHVDDHTRIDHHAPETRSDEAFRGVIGRGGRGVFNGKVVVHRGAQRIDARQSNDNLLLSAQAEIDTKPELEIYADDVKCSHGATVGELDAEHLFYLRSRGLDEASARELLTMAFTQAVLERIRSESLRERLSARVGKRLREIAESAS
jgi:Fe-S cluster assembly protein SufD